MSDDETFEYADAGAADCTPIQAGAVKKGGHVAIKGHPCKVVDYSTSKTGKHGHAKANIVGIDIFTGKKYEEIAPTSANLAEPVITRNEYELVDIQVDRVSLMDDEGNMREDLNLPADNPELVQLMKDAVAQGKELKVVVIKAMGQEMITGSK